MPNKSVQQRRTVAARKKKAKHLHKASLITAQINARTKASISSHRRDNRLLFPETKMDLNKTEELLCRMFGEPYCP